MSKIYYAVTLERTEKWNWELPLRQQQMWDEHAEFMDGLVSKGFVILGGPIGDQKKVLQIINAKSEQAIHDQLAADPWSPEGLGLLRIINIERWEVLLDAHDL